MNTPLCIRLSIVTCACSLISAASSLSIPAEAVLNYEIFDTVTNTFIDAVNLGSQSLAAGSNTFTGVVFGRAETLFPYVQNVMSPDVTVLHPGTFNTLSLWSVLTISNLATGTYSVIGAFARANDAFGAGDGVTVSVIKNEDFDAPLYSGLITSAHVVDITDVFSGSGVSGFDFSISLVPDDTLRILVTPGIGSVDGTFDATAVKLSISNVPEPSTISFFSGVILWVLVNRARSK